MRQLLSGLAIVLGTLLATLGISATPVRADLTFGSLGTGAGHTNRPTGIAVDRSNGRLYVADSGNRRVDVFTSSGTFIMAFGWGVADGAAELETCTITCLAGGGSATATGFGSDGGGGAGQFSSELSGIALDNDSQSPSYHDVYVYDSGRVQKFSPAGEFLATWGGGVITGGATGTGTLTAGSPLITAVETLSKAFQVGQTVQGAGIPAKTRILEIGERTLTLSRSATGSGTAVALTVAEGVGNVPVNERQKLTFLGSSAEGYIELELTTLPPDYAITRSVQLRAGAPANGPGSVQAALEALPNIGAGNVTVTGAVGGPYTVEFTGALADTDVRQLIAASVGPGMRVETERNGHSAAAICAAAVAEACSEGVIGDGETGTFSRERAALAVTGTSGTVEVTDTTLEGAGETTQARVQQFDPSGQYLSEIGPLGNTFLTSLAATESGDLYVSDESATREYEKGATLVRTLPQTGPLGLDEAGDLYRGEGEDGLSDITVYDPAANIQTRFGYGLLDSTLGGLVAYETSAGQVFVTEGGPNNQIHELAAPAPGPVVYTPSVTSSSVLATTATVEGAVNPEGAATTYHFEYVDQHDYETEGGFASPHVQRTAESSSLGTDFTLHDVSTQIAGMTPETKYYFRLVATNSASSSTGREASLLTLPPLVLGREWATEVTPEAASLHAEVNPVGVDATGYFEYVDDATFKESGFASALQAPAVGTGATPLDFGSAVVMSSASTSLYPLRPETTYDYRVVVTDGFVTEQGATQSLVTRGSRSQPDQECPNRALRTGLSIDLPDCRAYEMVSPVDKNNGDALDVIDVTGFRTRLDQSASSGESFSYTSARAFPGSEGAPYASQYLAARDPATGWSSRPILPQQSPADSRCCYHDFDNEYQAFSSDLSSGWLSMAAEPPLAAGAVEDTYNLYRRDNLTNSYEAVSTPESGFTTLPAGIEFQGDELDGTAADGQSAAFATSEKLTAAGTGGVYQLYDFGGGTVHFACVLPGGTFLTTGCSAGTSLRFGNANRDNTVANSLSADGRRLYWTAAEEGTGTLYVRENPGAQQSALSGTRCTEPEKACTVKVSETVSNEPAQFWTASADGGKALFTVGENLFEFNLATKQSTLIARKTAGVVGASADLSYIYFVAEEALAGAAEAGKPNLYLWHEGEPTEYIATLAARDVAEEAGFADVSRSPINRTARVTPDGQRIVFTSAASITGYDNLDAHTGEADEEVYTFEAGAPAPVCVSCDPSGARPAGGLGGRNSQVPIAATIPAWETQLYAPHVLSDDGARIFFESYSPLVASDSNGTPDVYEWESAEHGNCRHESSDYSQAASGCVSLISSGESAEGSILLDASANGDDVFFATGASLSPQDPGLVDVYDARVDGGFPVQQATTPCEGEACQAPSSPPTDVTPSSLTFNGPGNMALPPSSPVTTKAKPLTRAQKLSRALKTCRKKSRKARPGCERRARQSFGPKRSSTSANGKHAKPRKAAR